MENRVKRLSHPNTPAMLKPIGDHILVQPLSKEEKTKSGLYIPDSSEDKLYQGQILALGQGKYEYGTLVTFEHMGLKVGQTIAFKQAPSKFLFEGEFYYDLSPDRIVGIVE